MNAVIPEHIEKKIRDVIKTSLEDSSLATEVRLNLEYAQKAMNNGFKSKEVHKYLKKAEDAVYKTSNGKMMSPEQETFGAKLNNLSFNLYLHMQNSNNKVLKGTQEPWLSYIV